MLRDMYNLVMDPDKNALSSLPKTVRFQIMMVLAYMWSGIFAIWTGYMVVFGPSLLAHTILLVGIFFTAEIFSWARNRHPITLRANGKSARS